MECDVSLPPEVCILAGGSDVFEVDGLILPEAATSPIPCTSAIAESQRKDAELRREVKLVELDEGEKKNTIKPPAKTEEEKMVARAAIQNFLAMREMTRLID